MYQVNINAELRGIEQKSSKSTGNVYFVFHLENPETAEPFTLTCRDAELTLNKVKGKVYQCVCDLNIGRYNTLTLVNVKGDK